MFTLGVSDHVMIAHSFRDPFFGPAQRLHGAATAIDLEVRVPSLGPHEVVVDIGALRQILRGILEQIEYRNLDEHAAFEGRLDHRAGGRARREQGGRSGWPTSLQTPRPPAAHR